MKLKTELVQVGKLCFFDFVCFEWLNAVFYSVVTQVNDGPNYLVYITDDIFFSCARQNLLDLELVSKLKDMLDEYNVFVSQPTLRREYEAKSQRSIFQKEKRVVVSTNVYSRKTFEKQKRQRYANFENEGSGVI